MQPNSKELMCIGENSN